MSRLVVVLVALFSLAEEAVAQRAVLFYDHEPGDLALSARTSHILPGDRVDSATLQPRRTGSVRMLEIEEGSEVCFQIEDANPVLYSYATTTEVITIDPPSEWPEVVKGISAVMGRALLETADSAPGERTEAEEDLLEYMRALDAIQQIHAGMVIRKARSDSIASFEESRRRIAADHARAAVRLAEAQKMYEGLSGQEPSVRRMAAMLHTIQVGLGNRIKTIHDEFEDGARRAREPLCVSVESQPIRVTLIVKARAAGGKVTDRARPMGEVLNVEVRPVSTAWFAMSYGLMVGTGFDDRQKFSLVDGVVRGTSDDEPAFVPALFAQVRSRELPWLWGSVGTTVDEDGLTGLFVGATGRFGRVLGGPEVNLGVGLSLFEVPVGLKQGEVGKPLPDGIEDLEDIVERELRPGFGLQIGVTGLELGKKKEEKKE